MERNPRFLLARFLPLVQNPQMYWVRSASLLFAATVLVACGGESIGVQVATIEIDPSELDLSLSAFGTIQSYPVTVKSVGSASLEITGLTLVGASDGAAPPLDLALTVPEALPKRLAPSTTFVVELSHLPRDNVLDEGRLLITSDDPAQRLVTVPIRQRAVGAPRIAAVPDAEAAALEAATPAGVRTFVAAVRFGQVQPGLRQVETLHVVNVGGGGLPLEITEVDLSSSASELELRVEPNPSPDPLLLAVLGTSGLRQGVARSFRVELA